jgi:hypothetical protein
MSVKISSTRATAVTRDDSSHSGFAAIAKARRPDADGNPTPLPLRKRWSHESLGAELWLLCARRGKVRIDPTLEAQIRHRVNGDHGSAAQ